ncbi:MAG: ADP-ribosyltransferase [Sulfobacillus sp.]
MPDPKNKCPSNFPQLRVYRQEGKIFACCSKSAQVLPPEDEEARCKEADIVYSIAVTASGWKPSLWLIEVEPDNKPTPSWRRDFVRVSYDTLILEALFRCIPVPASAIEELRQNYTADYLDAVTEKLQHSLPTANWFFAQREKYLEWRQASRSPDAADLDKLIATFAKLYSYRGDRILNLFLRANYADLLASITNPENEEVVRALKLTPDNFYDKLVLFHHTLSRAIELSPKFDKRVVLWRGQSGSDNFAKGTVNGLYTSAGMLSTSLLASVAYMTFTSSSSGMPHLVKIIVPPGYRALYMENLTTTGTEYEVLLDHGTVYYVLSPVRRIVRNIFEIRIEMTTNTILLVGKRTPSYPVFKRESIRPDAKKD